MTRTPKDGSDGAAGKAAQDRKRRWNARKRGPGPAEDSEGFTWRRQVYQIPDQEWGFTGPGTGQHPGLCLGLARGGSVAVFVKGQGGDDRMRRFDEVVVAPSDENGLKKDTNFSLYPRTISMRRVRLYHKNRWLGTASEEDTQRIRDRIVKLFDGEQGH